MKLFLAIFVSMTLIVISTGLNLVSPSCRLFSNTFSFAIGGLLGIYLEGMNKK